MTATHVIFLPAIIELLFSLSQRDWTMPPWKLCRFYIRRLVFIAAGVIKLTVVEAFICIGVQTFQGLALWIFYAPRNLLD